MINNCRRIEDFLYKILLCSKNSILIYLFLYKFTFSLVYILVISSFFSYVGYTLQIDFFRIVVSMPICLAIFLDIQRFMKGKNAIFSNIILFLLDIGYAIPMITLYEFGGMKDSCFMFFVLFWLCFHLSLYFISRIKNYLYGRVKINRFVLFIGIVIIIFLGLYISYKYNSRGLYVSLKNVYQIRDEFDKKGMSLVFQYIYSMLSSVIPVCVTISLYHKRYIFVLIFSYIQINLYSISAMKKYLFFLVLAWGFYFIFTEKKYKYLILPGLSILNLAAIIDYKISSGMPQIANYFQRRTFMLPTRLYTYYFDFFSVHEPDYFQQSFLRFLGFTSRYDIPIANIIGGGYEYLKSYESTASNGLCGDAIANMGWGAILIYPLLHAIVLSIFNLVTKEINFSIKMIIAMIFFVYLTNGALFSDLLTNGFILLWFVLWGYNKLIKKDNCKECVSDGEIY